jgi:hypothetical protein
MPPDTSSRKFAGGRPKGDPSDLRLATIGVRVSAGEYAALREKAAQMLMTPAQWLRVAALSRRLPSPPVAAINREAAMELSRASAGAQQAAENLDRVGQWTEWRHYLLAVMTGMMSAMLVTAFWLWLAPPFVQNHLDAKAVAEYLRPEIAAVNPSK